MRVVFLVSVGSVTDRVRLPEPAAEVDGRFDLFRERETHLGASAYEAFGRLRAMDDGWVFEGTTGVTTHAYERECDLGELFDTEHDVVVAAGARHGAVLWVHRLFVGPVDAAVVSLHYAREVLLSRGARARIGEGVSSLTDAADDHLLAVLEALCVATQIWSIVDDIARRAHDLAADAAAMGATVRHGPEQLADRAGQLALEARAFVELSRRLRSSLLDGRGVVFEAAIVAWRIDHDLDTLLGQADACARYAELQSEALRSRSDHRRNTLLFAVGATSVTQSLIAGYELAVGDDTSWGDAPRPLLAIATGLPVVVGVSAALVVVLASWLADRR